MAEGVGLRLDVWDGVTDKEGVGEGVVEGEGEA